MLTNHENWPGINKKELHKATQRRKNGSDAMTMPGTVYSTAS